MEEQILKMISTGEDNGNESLANKITFHIMEFIEWLREEADIGNFTWDIGDGMEYSSGEVYQYWLTNIKTK